MSLKISSLGILNITTTPSAIAGLNRTPGDVDLDMFLITQDHRRLLTEDDRYIIVKTARSFLNTEDNRILLTESGVNILTFPI